MFYDFSVFDFITPLSFTRTLAFNAFTYHLTHNMTKWVFKIEQAKRDFKRKNLVCIFNYTWIE
jgi:hypothetical protein